MFDEARWVERPALMNLNAELDKALQSDSSETPRNLALLIKSNSGHSAFIS